jgi:SWIM zinc finger
MADQILADTRHTTRQDIKQAILQRTTRGMLTYNTGKVRQLEGELWAVPSTRGGFHQVDLDQETCDCEDFTFYGSAVGVACRHVYAAAIARARDGRRSRCGCSLCFGGYITMTAEEDGQERDEAVPCRRCDGAALETL